MWMMGFNSKNLPRSSRKTRRIKTVVSLRELRALRGGKCICCVQILQLAFAQNKQTITSEANKHLRTCDYRKILKL